MKTVRDLFCQSVVKVQGAGTGSGAWISHRHVLTCFHVVENLTEREIPLVVFPVFPESNADGLPAKVILEGPRPLDLVVLEVLAEIEPHPHLNFDQQVEGIWENRSFYTFGFGGPAHEAHEISHLQFGGRRQLSAEVFNHSLADRRVTPGFSGAPVCLQGPGNSVGLLRTTFDQYQPQGGSLIPAKLIREFAGEWMDKRTHFSIAPPIAEGESKRTLLQVIEEARAAAGQSKRQVANRLRRSIRDWFHHCRDFDAALEAFGQLENWESIHLNQNAPYRGTRDKMLLSKLEKLGREAPEGIRHLLARVDTKELLLRGTWLNIFLKGCDAESHQESLPRLLGELAQAPNPIREKVALSLAKSGNLSQAEQAAQTLPADSYRKHYVSAAIALAQGDARTAFSENEKARRDLGQERQEARILLQFTEIVACHWTDFSEPVHRQALETAKQLLDRPLQPMGKRFQWERVRDWYLVLALNWTPTGELEPMLQGWLENNNYGRPLVGRKTLGRIQKYIVGKNRKKAVRDWGKALRGRESD